MRNLFGIHVKPAFLFSLISLVSSGQVLAANPAHALRQTAQEVVFHYGVVPAAVVLAHPDRHPEREMHHGAAPKGASHLVVAPFDAAKGERIADADWAGLYEHLSWRTTGARATSPFASSRGHHV